MNTTLEDDVRVSLHTWANEVLVPPGDPEEAMTRNGESLLDAADRMGKPVLWSTAAAIALVVVIAAGLGGGGAALVSGGIDSINGRAMFPEFADNSAPPRTPKPWAERSKTAATVRPGGVALASLAAPVVFRPADPGWHISNYYLSRLRPILDVVFTHTDGRQFELALRKPGCCPPRPDDPNDIPFEESTPTVRGHAATANEHGGFISILWEEADWTWELRSPYSANLPEGIRPVSDRAELLAMANDFQLTDHATYEDSLPDTLATVLRASPGAGEVVWNGGDEYNIDGTSLAGPPR